MALPDAFLSTTCDLYRPFGSATPIAAGVACRLVADYSRSRMSTLAPMWTHYLLVNPGVDIRDAVARGVGSATPHPAELIFSGNGLKTPVVTNSRRAASVSASGSRPRCFRVR